MRLMFERGVCLGESTLYYENVGTRGLRGKWWGVVWFVDLG